MRTLQQMVDERKFKGLNRISLFQLATGALDSVDKCGLLELRGFKNKLYVVVAGDKVFLYKNAEVCIRGGCLLPGVGKGPY